MLSLTAPKDTLRYHLTGRPVSLNLDRSSVAVTEVIKAMKKYESKAEKKSPEPQALLFYYLNHAVAEVRKNYHLDEPLGNMKAVLDAYGRFVPEQAARLFYYLLVICTRESRHVKRYPEFVADFKAEFPPECNTFNESISGNYSHVASKILRASPPFCELGHFVKSLQWVFYNGKFSYGYGGPAWGAVADCLVEFVYGRYTAEMLLDVGWTLAHNNGPIFNKEEFYEAQDDGVLGKILDVQRAGQIPQLYNDISGGGVSEPFGHIVVEAEAQAIEAVKGLIGKPFAGHVDWWMVEALGSVYSYPAEKTLQATLHGPSEAWADMQNKVHQKEIAEKAEFNKHWFVVGVANGGEVLKVKKLTRQQLEVA